MGRSSKPDVVGGHRPKSERNSSNERPPSNKAPQELRNPLPVFRLRKILPTGDCHRYDTFHERMRVVHPICLNLTARAPYQNALRCFTFERGVTRESIDAKIPRP